MAIQLVTPENFSQFAETGVAPEFKAPEPVPAAERAPKAPDTSEVKPAEQAAPVDNKAEPAVKDSGEAKAPNDSEDLSEYSEKVRKKIGAKHAQMKQAEAYADVQYRRANQAEQRVRELEEESSRLKEKSKPAQTEAKEPKPDDFATVGEYTKAVAKQTVSAELEADRQKQSQEAAQREADQAFAQRLEKAREKYPDFVDVVSTLKDTEFDRVPQDVIGYIKESELGPEIIRHLASDHSELARLQKLSPRRFIAELGKLELQLAPKAKDPDPKPDVKAAAEVKPVSRAPAPVTPLDGKAAAAVTKDPSQMSWAEYKEHLRATKQWRPR